MFITPLTLLAVYLLASLATLSVVAMAIIAFYYLWARHNVPSIARYVLRRMPAPRPDRLTKPATLDFQAGDGSLMELDFANRTAVQTRSAPQVECSTPATPEPSISSPMPPALQPATTHMSELVGLLSLPAAHEAYNAELPRVFGDFEELVNHAGLSPEAFSLGAFRLAARRLVALRAAGYSAEQLAPMATCAPAPATAEQHQLRQRAGLVLAG